MMNLIIIIILFNIINLFIYTSEKKLKGQKIFRNF